MCSSLKSTWWRIKAQTGKKNKLLVGIKIIVQQRDIEQTRKWKPWLWGKWTKYSTGHLAGAFLCIRQSVTYRDAETSIQQEICFLTRSQHFSHDKNLHDNFKVICADFLKLLQKHQLKILNYIPEPQLLLQLKAGSWVHDCSMIARLVDDPSPLQSVWP